ncbi:MAG: hypothetical protein ACRDLB_03720 [Actinomycetota bacterium]
MKTRTAAICSLLLLSGMLTAAPAAGSQADMAEDKTDNVKLLTNIPYEGGSDIAFQGDNVYFGQLGNEGGVRVLDASGKIPKEIAFLPCPGSQNDVAVVKRGLLALGYHNGQCGAQPGAGVRLIDVRNPKSPRYLGSVEMPGGAHTITVYPGTNYIYASPGGLPGNGERGGQEQIIDVSNPKKARDRRQVHAEPDRLSRPHVPGSRRRRPHARVLRGGRRGHDLGRDGSSRAGRDRARLHSLLLPSCRRTDAGRRVPRHDR